MPEAHILVVEDEPINLEILSENLKDAGYRVTPAEDAESAWTCLSRGEVPFDAVLLDRMLPDLDGLEVLRRIKADPALAGLPVIIQTAMTAQEDIQEGLQAGAYYYLTKPITPETLLAIVQSATEDHQERLALEEKAAKAAKTFSLLEAARFSFRSPADVSDIAALLANVHPDPMKIAPGLSELMLNAVEHGNLGITYQEKSDLIRDERLHDEIRRRLALPEHADKQATIDFERHAAELRFLIRDQGQGFAWNNYLEISPERAFDTHGRGIAMARMLSFSQIEYRGCGNELLATVKL